jgi:hypothetical protein
MIKYFPVIIVKKKKLMIKMKHFYRLLISTYSKDVFELWPLGVAKLFFLQYKLKNNLQFITYSSCFYYNDKLVIYILNYLYIKFFQ